MAIGDRLIAAGIDGYLRHYTAPRATREQIARVHGARYIDEIERASPKDGLTFVDPDTALNPHTLDAAFHAAGAAVKAVDLVMTNECTTAFCAVRPPGHHAERSRAMGFCLFNNVAIGAAHALAEHGLSRVAIVDFDVHHGNGTEEIFTGDHRVLMVSTFQHPLYPYCGLDNDDPKMVNIPLSPGSGGEEFRAAVRDRWLPALDEHRPELIFVSAGFDAHREDPLANLKLVEGDYAWVTRELAQVAARHASGRIVSSLEGGYSLSALGRSVAEHVRELVAS
jgi:acetoin utilization deacetylase AcuC-like enzyme